ncbi:hypothetical protein Tcan_10446 [Toxocara canis]|uniref:Uncharacterized protein n=1 Tax=Toxocara canis TaxID=6265 RepID=A0A0B2V2K7_TOXCA|nr:hypothetical protein Tcan_10446 [Toxocara canis]
MDAMICELLLLFVHIENPTFPVADSTRGSETDIEPVITGGDFSAEPLQPPPNKLPTPVVVIEVNANAAANEEKREELRSACAFVLKRERQDETERNKENMQKLAKEEITDGTQPSDELEITANQKKTETRKNRSKCSERKTLDKMSPADQVKDKSVRIVKNVFRIGVRGNAQEAQLASKGKQSERSRSKSTKLRSARAKSIILKRDDGKQKADSGKGIDGELAEKRPQNNVNERVSNSVNDKLKKEENGTAKSVERTQMNTTQRSLFISEKTQSTNNWRTATASSKKVQKGQKNIRNRER